MKHLTVIFFTSLILLVGGMLAQAQTIETGNAAKVVFYRSVEDGGRAYSLTSQNQELVKLKKGEKFEQNLAPGLYYYMADPSTRQVFKLEIKAGQTYYVLASRDEDLFDGQPMLRLSTVQEYQQDLAEK